MMISRNLAVAMTNADTSGLTEKEVELIKDFPDFTVTNWHGESSDINAKCALTHLWDHCVEIEIIKKRQPQQNFNNYHILSDDDINQLHAILGKGCRKATKDRLLSMLKYGKSTIPYFGILERLMKEDGQWSYCPGQSYPDEIRTVRKIIMTGKA